MPAARRPAEVSPVPVELRIESLAFGGEGVARHDGKVRFVPGALAGETVLAEPARRRRQYDRMRLLRVLIPSPERRAPLCPHTAVCGGCVLQELSYGAQLAAKAAQVRDCLERIGGLRVPEVGPPTASPTTTAYRNKMEFTFARRAWIPEGKPESPPPGPALGLHVPGRFDAVFDLEECALPSPACVEALRAVREFAREEELPAWRSDDESGLLRHLVVREGAHTGEILIGLVASAEHPAFPSLGPLLAARVPGLVGLVLIVNRRKATVARGDEERVLWGRPWFGEELAGLTFQLSVQSFFQTNTLGAERLVDAIRSVLGERARGRLLDLYCGPGTFSLALAGAFAEVHGVEQAASSIADARRNAERNGVGHVRFTEAVVEDWLAVEAIGGAGSIHGYDGGVLLDPPRAGLHPKAVRGVLGLRPPWILYVSCNPSTLARDAKLFVEGGYRADRLQIVDLFPHTAHVESVLLMERDGSGREPGSGGTGAPGLQASEVDREPPCRHLRPDLL